MASAAIGSAYRHLRDLFSAGSVIGLEDGQLLARYSRSNDSVAFEALVNRHGPMVLATCRAVLRNEHDAEDAFQATFLVLAKKAHSVRGGEALGGWLHRVAYRASVQASIQRRKRLRKEAEASAMAPLDASPAVPSLDHEPRLILHEEVERLSERHRLPVVLCDLEGLTYEQAAEQLQWTVPTLRCRLAKARQKLKERLMRRGVNPLAAGPLLLPKASLAIVPPALLKATVQAATGGAASAGAAVLTHTLLRGMLMTKIKIASTAALSALTLATAGVIAAGSFGSPEMGPAPAAQVNPPDEDAPAASFFDLKGRVVGPDGQPVAFPRVRADLSPFGDSGHSDAVCSADGRFVIRLPSPVGDSPRGVAARFPRLVASAPGLGVAWLDGALQVDRPGGPVLTLPPGGPPIEGRVIDLEGRPIAGATVAPVRIWADPEAKFASWVAKARGGSITNPGQGLEPVRVGRPIGGEARTDSAGRFRLDGLGLDCVIELICSGEGHANTTVHVLPGDGPEIRLKEPGIGIAAGRAHVIHAGRLELAMTTGRRVEGTARDQETGRPIAGLDLRAGVADDPYGASVEGVEARTDDQGRYHLDGLPVAGAYQLRVSAGPGLPYTDGTLKVDSGASRFAPVRFDIALKRAVVVRGKVTDRVTGRPVRGTVFFMALGKNGKASEYPGYRDHMDLQAAWIEPDGRYEIAALPGPGLLAVIDLEGRHLRASGLEKMDGYIPSMDGFETSFAPIPAAGYHLFRATAFDPSTVEATVDLALDPGRSVSIEILDPEGHPLGGTKVIGIGDDRGRFVQAQASPRFEVVAINPAKPRRLTVTHEGRKLAGSAYLKGDEAALVPLRLSSWGKITGRFVDDEGRPLRNIQLMGLDQVGEGRSRLASPETLGSLPRGPFGTSMTLGDDGRFLVEGLVPGLRYGGYASRAGMGLGVAFRDVVVSAGEVKDLGDLKVQPPKKTEE